MKKPLKPRFISYLYSSFFACRCLANFQSLCPPEGEREALAADPFRRREGLPPPQFVVVIRWDKKWSGVKGREVKQSGKCYSKEEENRRKVAMKTES